MTRIVETSEALSSEEQVDEPMPFVVRPARTSKEDNAFVVAALRTVLEERAIAVARALAHQIARTGMARIACSSDDLDTLLGFAIFTDSSAEHLHYAFVKPAFRRFGVGSRLVEPDKVRAYSIKNAKTEHFRPVERGWEHRPLKVTL